MAEENNKVVDNNKQESSTNRIDDFKRIANALTMYANGYFSKDMLRVPYIDSSSSSLRTGFSSYSKSTVKTYLDNPRQYTAQLRDLSNYLYATNPYYKRLVDYFAKAPLFAYVLLPSGFSKENVKPKVFKREYLKTEKMIETMDINNSFASAFITAWLEDYSFNYVWMTDDAFMLQKLPPDRCRVESRIGNGVLRCSFDFAFFDRDPSMLDTFDKEFKTKYKIYKSKGRDYRWQELDAEKTLVLKANLELDYAIPPLAGTFLDLYDIEDYKGLVKAKEKLNNYKLLNIQIPTNPQTGELLMDWDLAMIYYEAIARNLGEQLGSTLSPFTIQPIDLQSKSPDGEQDLVTKAIENLWSAAGVSSLMFNNSKASSNSLQQSLIADMAMVYNLLAQLEVWLNFFLKIHTKSKFCVKMLPVTHYNRDKKLQELKELVSLSLPLEPYIMAIEKLSMSEASALNYMVKDVFHWKDEFVPLATAHTQSNKGRPSNESRGVNLTDDSEKSLEATTE